jgi:hypothetical protein
MLTHVRPNFVDKSQITDLPLLNPIYKLQDLEIQVVETNRPYASVESSPKVPYRTHTDLRLLMFRKCVYI